MTATNIIDALDAANYGEEYAAWLGALMSAIELDAKHNQGRQVATLAGLGQYLADDCASYLKTEVNRLRRDLETKHEAQTLPSAAFQDPNSNVGPGHD